jgi:hypothetical protein
VTLLAADFEDDFASGVAAFEDWVTVGGARQRKRSADVALDGAPVEKRPESAGLASVGAQEHTVKVRLRSRRQSGSRCGANGAGSDDRDSIPMSFVPPVALRTAQTSLFRRNDRVRVE